MHPVIILLYAFTFFANPSKPVRDTCEIKGNGYEGYIMPLKGTQSKYDPANVYYQPPESEVILAEKMLASYLDIFCRNNKNWRNLNLNSTDSARYPKLFMSYFKGYYRQYTAYMPMKNLTHRFISICLVSPDFQDRVRDKPGFLKNHWAEIDDGGPILFHADVDLITGDVFLRDNGGG